ncbi:hypothetical protein [Pseudonocardia acaciae]|uniref:hypothetical protein n=1 Tax=Pseudonocardia acaciae TaxID=551276 RepID=UPI0012ED1E7F|nr:hypothetical protein [Pseudonocardia acaciae]
MTARHLQRLASGQATNPHKATSRVLQRQFGHPVAELLGPLGSHGQSVDAGADWASGEDDDMRRRTLLLGAVVSGMVAGAEPVRRSLDAALALHTTVRDVADWERTVDEYARLSAQARVSRDQLLPHLLADLDEVRTHLAAADGSLRPALAGVCARLSGLAAVALVSAGYWSEAARYWRTAQRAARSSDDRDLSGHIGGRRAIFSLYGPGGTASTLRIADDVLAETGGKPSSGTASALGARAQVLALEGDRAGAHSTLSELEHVFDELGDAIRSDPTMWGWSEHRLHHTRSFVHSYLGNTRDAGPAQDAALALCSPRSLAVAQVKFHQAACMIVSGDVVQGTHHVAEVYESLAPGHRNGHMSTSAMFALNKVPAQAARLRALREVRELVSSA